MYHNKNSYWIQIRNDWHKINILLTSQCSSKLVCSDWIQCSGLICTKWRRVNFSSFKFCCKLLMHVSHQNLKKCSTRSAHYFVIKWKNSVLGYAFLLSCVRWEFDPQFTIKQRQKVKLLAWYKETWSIFILGQIKHA